MISTSYHAFESGHSTPLEAGCIVCWLTVAPASKNCSAGDITICVAGPAAWRCWRRSASFGGASRLSNALRSDRAMEIAASLARDKFTMSVLESPRRTRHIPGHLESGSILATARRPNLSVVAFMLPRSTRLRCTTDHKLGIRRYNGRAGFQIARSFERAA